MVSAVVLAWLGSALATPVLAQTAPLPVIPTPPPAPPPQPGATLQTVPTAPTFSRWEYLLGIGGGYNSNVFFLADGPSDTVITPRAELAHVSRGPTGELRLAATSRAVAYVQQQDTVAVDASLSVAGRKETSAQTTLSGQLSGGVGHTDDSALLNEQGVLLPFSRTRFGRADGSVAWRTSTRTTLELRGRAYYDDFVEPTLADSGSVRGSLNRGRRVSERTRLSGEYAVEYSHSNESFTSQFGSFKLEHQISARSGFLVEAGSSYTDYASAQSTRPTPWNFYGGLGLARVLGPSSTALFVRREVIPAFGLGGVQLSDRVGLRTSSRLGRSWRLDGDVNYVRRNASTQASGDRSDSVDVRFALLRRIRRRFDSGADLVYRRYAPQGSPAIEQWQAQFTVSVVNPEAGQATP